ncbi:lytic murein transglycosylase [Alphaproteobacteria bacterium]|nr:lytic murein transglycosylase [Alphaproteobacteria bacterium]
MLINFLQLFIFLNFILLLLFKPVFAISFNEYKMSIIKEGLVKGISKEVLQENIGSLKNVNEKVLKYYNNQPEFKITLNQYQKRNITSKRIKKGQMLINKHKKILDKVSEKYKVPPEIIVSIWALESNYGHYTGSFSIIDALTTLSFQSKRKSFFKKELFNALEILNKKQIEANKLTGSWAGAMGQSQFMPSSYLSYAIDFNNDKKIDIWNTKPDIFASIANYLNIHGWEKDEPWSIKLEKVNKNMIDYNKKYVFKEIKESIAIKQNYVVIPENSVFQIKQIISNNQEENYLVFENFFVLKKYNNSDFYALTVGKLANMISSEK